MAIRRDSVASRRTGLGWHFSEWVMGIVGGIGAFLGLFMLFADENEYVGLGGDLSWRIGDISAAWTYSLLIGGVVLLAAAVAMMIVGRGRAPALTSPHAELLLHAVVFTVVNAFIWAQDLSIGGGIEYAHFTTIPWGIGLLIHAGAVFFGAKRPESVQEPVEERELQHH